MTQTAEEKEAIAKQASEIAQEFAEKSGKEETYKPSLVALKMERMQLRAKSGDVLIEEIGHKQDGQWVARAEAENMKVDFVDPVKWVMKRLKTAGRFGTIKRLN